MINRLNLKEVIEKNNELLPSILSKVDAIFEKGLHYKYKTIESIQNYLMKNSEVILYPSEALSYGGMVLYRNGSYYIHVNTLQPKTYENFVWAHEFYHFEFEKERIKNVNEPTFVHNPILDDNERRANLFAAELLINNSVLETIFNEIKENNPDDPLAINIIRLMPVFELPYKTLVIKLAQDNLITIEQAEEVIDCNYRQLIPKDFDLSILEPSKAIKVDSLNKLLETAISLDVMAVSDLESIQALKDKHFQQLENIRNHYTKGV